MAQIRNYRKGIFETQTTKLIGQVSSADDTFIMLDGILTNAFSDLVLYEDAGGTSPLPIPAYEQTTIDTRATALEAETSTGGSGKTVYSQFKVVDASYYNIDLYATFSNFGTYTDNDATFEQNGASIGISSSQTVELSDGAIKTFITVDTSLGSATATLPDGLFVGQQAFVICSGSGLAYVKGTGVYDGASALGTPISDGLKGLWTWSGSAWIADSELTADYVSSDFFIKQSSSGVMVIEYQTDAISTAGTDIALPVGYNDVINIGYHLLISTAGAAARQIVYNASGGASTATKVQLISNNANSQGSLRTEGKY